MRERSAHRIIHL